MLVRIQPGRPDGPWRNGNALDIGSREKTRPASSLGQSFPFSSS
jgi:hypothetical protein